MKIPLHHKENFRALLRAADHNRLALLDCRDKETGKSVFVIVAMSDDGKNGYEMVPFAKMFADDPYKELNPPDPKGGYYTETELAHG